MKQIFIPNSLHFSAIPTGTEKFMSIFDITSKKHTYINTRDAKVSKANKYLRRMYRRLEKLSILKHPLRFTKVALVLLQKSLAFRLAATNFKSPKWFYKGTGTDAKHVFKTVLKLGKELATNIDYTRHWIPKGLIKYMRPIGSPTVPWRIYLWEWYFITDMWISHNGGRAPWQHGGFSRKGPNTFFEQLITEGRHKKPFIFEFDLKGYFNNVTHKSILEALKSIKTPTFIINHMKEALKAQPTGYKIPPLAHDQAVKRAETNRKTNQFMESMGLTNHTLTKEDLRKLQSSSKPLIPAIKEFASTKGLDPMMLNYTKPRMAKVYKDLMNNDTISDIRFIDKPWDRAIGRDNWANLGLPGKGTPQGVSYSPILTSILSSIKAGISNKNLMMYMDDGIITADSRSELEEAIQVFKDAAASMGVELAPEKSGMIKEDGIWLKELKIIGFRIDPWMDWVFSKTRSGTEVPMPRPDYEGLKEYYAGKEELLKEQVNSFTETSVERQEGVGEVSPPIKQYNDWMAKEIKRIGLDEFINSGMKELREGYPLTTHEIMAKEGKSGQALATIWNPNKGHVRDAISEGLTKTVNKIKANKRSWLANHMSESRLEGLGVGGYIQESISSLSTEMSRSVLEWDSRVRGKEVRSKKGNKLNKVPRTRIRVRGATIGVNFISCQPTKVYLFNDLGLVCS